ncbi:MAG: Cof-type HAD-IIB family hydrolase [Acidimicrobiia bacterium]|nr:Cof-type HAD-IIB family hydrolase [Acidimicrobiia bacterium]
MPTPVRLVATDLDGTLLGPDGQLSDRTRAALDAARAAGVVVAAATGRSHRTALPRVGNHVDWAVCSNGAVLYDVGHGVVDVHHPIGPELVARLVADLAAHIPEIGLAWETVDGFGADEAFHRMRPHTERLLLTAPLGDLLESNAAVTKVLVAHPSLVQDMLLEALRPVLPVEVEATTSGADFVEVTADGVDKAFTVGLLAERLGIERHEVLAFGDHLNDLPLLSWAGRSVAMANAHPAVLDVVAEHTDHHADDGVARVLETLVG